MAIQYLGQAKIFSLKHKEKEWKISVYSNNEENNVVFDDGTRQMTLPVDVLVQTLEGIHQIDPLLIDVILGSPTGLMDGKPTSQPESIGIESFGRQETNEELASDNSPVTDEEIQLLARKTEATSTPLPSNDVPLKRPAVKINPDRAIKRKE